MKEGLDAIATAQSDLDFQVSTDAASVREFLDAPFTGTKIVFSTYQSAQVIGAALKLGEAFDLAVFDEAHKTAGREGRNFAFALEDANLPIRKRLFLTATPRHYNPHDRDREGEAKLLFSMDNPEVFGPQAYRLTFAEAARRGIICGYKVIISVITSEMVTNELLSRGEVVVNGDAVRARQVANQIALRDAIEKYGASKVFTFHRTVESAASFVADGSEGVRTHLPEFGTFHVNGTMPTARREREMRDFRAAARAVMSNARCLTEGVDVPAVDMVAFLSPRRSRVDIVQATGRAMRRSPGKTRGYVLVPLYVELATGETVEAAVNRAEFDEVWDVLNSLQEQDDVLAELIRYVGEQTGRGKGFDDSQFADRIDIVGIQIGLEALRSAVTTRCFESLFSSWDTFFGKLTVFKERFGHCNVGIGMEGHQSLGAWVAAQRIRRKKGNLGDEQIQRLNDLGFVWDIQASSWDGWFEKLKAFKERFGHCNVETGWDEDPLFAGWAIALRGQRRRGVLSDERIARLNDLGFVWEWSKLKADETWMKWYRELESYARAHGNPHVPRTHTNTKLASWVWIQRLRREKDYNSQPKLTSDQVALLDKLDFRWDARGERWAESFEKLKQFKEKHGHCEVGLVAGEDDLLSWVRQQRSSKARGNLDAERQAQLDTLGFSWVGEMNDHRWDEMYQRLKDYQTQHGNADVPHRWKEDMKLAAWVGQQRQRRKKAMITDEQVCLLDELGFTWQHRERGSWDDRLAEVAAFKAKHGHCDIPVTNSANPKLGRFVNAMRTKMARGELSQHRISLLEGIGFKWAIREAKHKDAWEKRFDQLREFKVTNGHCDVPVEWPENPQLGHWVSNQRQRKKTGNLQPRQEELLNSIGFDWGLTRDFGGVKPQGLWPLRYEQLVEFKKQNGHCDVPYNYAENRQLGIWVGNQRYKRKQNKLPPERERLLNDLGFTWEDVERGVWDERFQELMEFKAKHGHCDVPVVYPENSKLGWFTKNMRAQQKSGTLSAEKIAKLDAMGFAWVSTRKATPPQNRNGIQEPVTSAWRKSFDELVAYQMAHGNCDVPVKWKENPQLGGWAAAQRALKKSGKLHPERERLLNEIGFDWHTSHTKEEWETRFEQLKFYKQRFGDCCVPTQWKENPQLGAWVANQRHKLKAGKLSGDKERLLIELGFVSAQRPTTTRGVNRAWSERFNELVQYKAQHGDCNVPTRWPDNRGLGVWVSNQRQLKKQGKLDSERELMLNEIGFVW